MPAAPHATFGPWIDWLEAPRIGGPALGETLDGGQAFRWNSVEDGFEGRWGRHVVRLKRLPSGTLAFSVPLTDDPARIHSELRRYFALDIDFSILADALPWRNDPILAHAIRAFPGLRILRQPPEETLFSFLCSPTKRIPQIKAACEAVAADLGHPLPDGSHALPEWSRIAKAGEARLRAAKLGYRARYIHMTALRIRAKPDWFQVTGAAPTPVARERLLALPGVGRKIADCVLLFGFGRLDAFPIDTWVKKLLARAYGLERCSMQQLQDFAHKRFGSAAGLAQQFLFAAARAGHFDFS